MLVSSSTKHLANFAAVLLVYVQSVGNAVGRAFAAIWRGRQRGDERRRPGDALAGNLGDDVRPQVVFDSGDRVL